MEGIATGRIVHFVDNDVSGNHLAAIITDVLSRDKGAVSLCVFLPNGLRFVEDCGYDESATRTHTWHWVERQ